MPHLRREPLFVSCLFVEVVKGTHLDVNGSQLRYFHMLSLIVNLEVHQWKVESMLVHN